MRLGTQDVTLGASGGAGYPTPPPLSVTVTHPGAGQGPGEGWRGGEERRGRKEWGKSMQRERERRGGEGRGEET